MHATRTHDETRPPASTLVLDEVLDAASCRAMRRFHKRARRAPRSAAAIDLRRTRAIGSVAWAILSKVVRDLARSGHAVTVLAEQRLARLLELSGFARHARVIILECGGGTLRAAHDANFRF
jgi:anti-anti-sigma regulatory factor